MAGSEPSKSPTNKRAAPLMRTGRSVPLGGRRQREELALGDGSSVDFVSVEASRSEKPFKSVKPACCGVRYFYYKGIIRIADSTIGPGPVTSQDDRPAQERSRAWSVAVAFLRFDGESSREAARGCARALGAERVEIHLVRGARPAGFELAPLEAEGPASPSAPLALVLGDAPSVEEGAAILRLLAPSADIERVGVLVDGHMALAENMEDGALMEAELAHSLGRARSEARHRAANELFLARLLCGRRAAERDGA